VDLLRDVEPLEVELVPPDVVAAEQEQVAAAKPTPRQAAEAGFGAAPITKATSCEIGP